MSDEKNSGINMVTDGTLRILIPQRCGNILANQPGCAVDLDSAH